MFNFLKFLFFFLFFLFCLFVSFFLTGDGVGTKDLVFHGGWGMAMEALLRKNTGVSGGAGHYSLCWPG